MLVAAQVTAVGRMEQDLMQQQHRFNMSVRLWCETLVLSNHIRLLRDKPSPLVFYLPMD